LAELGLEGGFVEELHEIDVACFLSKVFLQQYIDAGFEHEGIVDGDYPYLRHKVPAWTSAACL